MACGPHLHAAGLHRGIYLPKRQAPKAKGDRQDGGTGRPITAVPTRNMRRIEPSTRPWPHVWPRAPGPVRRVCLPPPGPFSTQAWRQSGVSAGSRLGTAVKSPAGNGMASGAGPGRPRVKVTPFGLVERRRGHGGSPLVDRVSAGRTCLRVRKAGAGIERERVRVRRWRCQVVVPARTPPCRLLCTFALARGRCGADGVRTVRCWTAGWLGAWACTVLHCCRLAAVREGMEKQYSDPLGAHTNSMCTYVAVFAQQFLTRSSIL